LIEAWTQLHPVPCTAALPAPPTASTVPDALEEVHAYSTVSSGIRIPTCQETSPLSTCHRGLTQTSLAAIATEIAAMKAFRKPDSFRQLADAGSWFSATTK
jgi:hypothetical protein